MYVKLGKVKQSEDANQQPTETQVDLNEDRASPEDFHANTNDSLSPEPNKKNKKEKLSCKKCKETFSSKIMLNKHYCLEESKESIYEDTASVAIFHEKNNESKSLEPEKKNKKEKFRCQGCNETFSSKMKLSQHYCLKESKGESIREETTEDLNENTNESKSPEPQKKDKKQKFSCQKCKETFSSKIKLSKHYCVEESKEENIHEDTASTKDLQENTNETKSPETDKNSKKERLILTLSRHNSPTQSKEVDIPDDTDNLAVVQKDTNESISPEPEKKDTNEIFKCGVCNETFSSEMELNSHYCLNTPAKEFREVIEKKNAKDKEHLGHSSEKKKQGCNHCCLLCLYCFCFF